MHNRTMRDVSNVTTPAIRLHAKHCLPCLQPENAQIPERRNWSSLKLYTHLNCNPTPHVDLLSTLLCVHTHSCAWLATILPDWTANYPTMVSGNKFPSVLVFLMHRRRFSLIAIHLLTRCLRISPPPFSLLSFRAAYTQTVMHAVVRSSIICS